MVKTMPDSSVGKRLQKAISYTGLTQRQFAKEIGVTENYISVLICKPKKGISYSLALLIEQIYGVSADWLLKNEGNMIKNFSKKNNSVSSEQQLISDRFKILRQRLNLSQRAFAGKIGVSRDVIARIEYGMVEPKDKIIDPICKIYDVNSEWLKNGIGEIFADNQPVIDIDDDINECKNVLRDLIEDLNETQTKKVEKYIYYLKWEDKQKK